MAVDYTERSLRARRYHSNGVTYTFSDGDYFLNNAMRTLGDNGLLLLAPSAALVPCNLVSNYDS